MVPLRAWQYRVWQVWQLAGGMLRCWGLLGEKYGRKNKHETKCFFTSKHSDIKEWSDFLLMLWNLWLAASHTHTHTKKQRLTSDHLRCVPLPTVMGGRVCNNFWLIYISHLWPRWASEEAINSNFISKQSNARPWCTAFKSKKHHNLKAKGTVS